MHVFRGKMRGSILFLAVSALMLGGLAWATRAALTVERERRLSAANSQASEQLFLEQKERSDRLRLALWRLDSRLSPALAREESRPYPQYIALHTPFPALTSTGIACAPGQVYLPSPLLTAELPDWMKLHFQIDATNGWTSPQVVADEIQKLLRKQPIELALNNVTTERAELLAALNRRYPANSIMSTFREMGVTAIENDRDAQRWAELQELVNSNRFNIRNSTNSNFDNKGDAAAEAAPSRGAYPAAQAVPGVSNPVTPLAGNAPQAPGQPAGPGSNFLLQQQLDFAYRVVVTNRARKESQWAYIFDDHRANVPMNLSGAFPSKTALTYQTVEVQLGAMHPIWLPSAREPEHLLMVRGARVGGKPVFQGVVADWNRLQELLIDEVVDLFPEAHFVPLHPGEPERPERTMTTLPVEFVPVLDPLPEQAEPVEADSLPSPGWTPLRIGLAFAWGATLIALMAMGLGGWSILDLSERRIRFVSAVTHELRTPLTTLRLYLDLLSSGMVTDETQKAEYLGTLNGEADRLHRLIGNVLDFARLEKSTPIVDRKPTPVSSILEVLRRTWVERCAAAGKDLQIENPLGESATVTTDPGLVEQIVGNLIDNAQKYSRDATDPSIVVRALVVDRCLALEVEDRGPGVNQRDRGSIFRPFRRGKDADVKAGGVGLGLALATRWARLLGGRLHIAPGTGGIGACFRLTLPAPELSASSAGQSPV